MMCKIVRSEKMMWPIFIKSNKRNKSQQSFEFTYNIDARDIIIMLIILKQSHLHDFKPSLIVIYYKGQDQPFANIH